MSKGASCWRVRLQIFIYLDEICLLAGSFFGKIFLSGRRESNKFGLLILGLWRFVLGEFRAILPLRSLFPPLGRRSLRAGSTPDYFFATSLLIVLGFVLSVTKLIFSGRRESNKFGVLILGLWRFVLGEFRAMLPLRSLDPPTWSALTSGGFDSRFFLLRVY